MRHDLRIAVAGRGNMGGPLLRRLAEEGYDVPLHFTRREYFINNRKERGYSHPLACAEVIRDLGPYLSEIDVMFLAVPSTPDEMALIDACLEHDIYVILLCKHALAYEYAKYLPYRHMIGANATVGGRTMILPWLRMQYVQGRKVVIYAYMNASMNYFMSSAAEVGSAEGAFKNVIALGLAEPGSDDYVSFVNGEIGADYPKKLSILMNDAVLPAGGPYISPDSFDEYVAMSKADIISRTLPSRRDRYLVRIDNLGIEPEFPRNVPGALYAEYGGYTISGGLYDMSRDDAISRWIKGGVANGVQVRFDGVHGYEGTVETAGPGAGEATIGAAMNDLYEFERARSGVLLEAQWPDRLPDASRLVNVT